MMNEVQRKEIWAAHPWQASGGDTGLFCPVCKARWSGDYQWWIGDNPANSCPGQRDSLPLIKLSPTP